MSNVPSKIDLNARLKAMGTAAFGERSPEDAANAVEELAHIATGMDMGTWSRISVALLGCINRCARLERDIGAHETTEGHAWYGVEGAATGKWEGLPVNDVICRNCRRVRPLLGCLLDTTPCTPTTASAETADEGAK